MTPRDLRRAGGRRYWTTLAVLALTAAGGRGGRGSREEAESVEAFWEVGKPASIAVCAGRASFSVPTHGPTAETLVIVSALSRSRGPFPIRLEARSADRGAVPVRAIDDPARVTKEQWSRPCHEQNRVAEGRLPPAERNFSMMVRDGDVASASNYTTIRGILKGVGRRSQVYVAAEDVARIDEGLVKDLIATFDDRIHPLASARLGEARDVDRDGRFTILLSSWLLHLGNGRHAVDGFVRVADLDPAFEPPFGNQCDMMYLSTALKAGPYVRTLMAHEYMHAVTFSAKSIGQIGSAGPVVEEEGWLDEAMAHLAEDLNGFSTSNIDYRVSAFLSRPDRYQLVVDDYFAANLFRSHGNRGSTYLFLRWCADHYGPDFLAALATSRHRGIANLELVTGASFASLFRQWSSDLYLSGLDPGKPGTDSTDKASPMSNLRSPYDEWELAGPRYDRVSADGPADCWTASGTSCHFAVVDGSRSGGVEIEISGPPDAALQVTALPLGPGIGRLELSVSKLAGARGETRFRARIEERHGVDVRLSALCWETLAPPAGPHESGFHQGRLDMLGIASAFGTSLVRGDGEIRSRPIPLGDISPDAGPLIFKVIGTDANGRRVAAWAEVDPANGGREHEP